MQVGTLQVSVFDAVIGCGVTDFGFAVVVVAGSESCGGEEEEEAPAPEPEEEDDAPAPAASGAARSLAAIRAKLGKK